MNPINTSILAAALTIGTLGSGAHAAPDGTLGMALLSAVVNADGTVDRGAGVVSAANLGSLGAYAVIFDRDVTNCTYVVNTAGAAFTDRFGFASAVKLIDNVNGLFVETQNTAGGFADLPFNVIVFCSK